MFTYYLDLAPCSFRRKGSFSSALPPPALKLRHNRSSFTEKYA